MKVRELEDQAKKELTEENIAEQKELLKERILEIRAARATLSRMEGQYQKLLDTEVE